MLKYFLLLACFVLLNLSLFGQTKDAEFWPSASVNYRINKKFRASLEQQLRLDDNISGFKSTFTEIGIRFRLNSFLRITPTYRFIIRFNEIRHRLTVDVAYRFRKKGFPLRASYRLRLQTVSNPGGNAINYIRNKIGVGYNLTKMVDPYMSGEVYYRLYNKPNELQKYRFTIGLDWSLNKKMDLSTFYRIQKEINLNNPETDHIIGIGYTYSIAKTKKSKK